MTGEAWTLRRRAFEADWRRGGAAGAPGGEDEAGARAAAFAAWLARAHEAQRPPGSAADGGDWSTWLFLGGRGAGKTHAGAAWLSAQAAPGARLALVGPTLREVGEVMVRGVSGLVALSGSGAAAGARPRWEAGRQRLVWPNGAQAHAFSAEAPDALRGPQFHAAWADELCAWRNAEVTLANLRLGLRLGREPKLVITTTPRPRAVLRRLRREPGLAETRAATGANAAHLAPGFLAGLTALYGGTRLAAQELEGQMVEGGGALFTAAMLGAARVQGRDVPACASAGQTL